MKLAPFSTKRYSQDYFEQAAQSHTHELTFFEPRLHAPTVDLARGFEAVCVFVNDDLSAAVLEKLAAGGTRVIALRCSGFNNVDLATADKLGMAVVRVPAYSPHAVAEHAVALMLTLNRGVHRAFNRVREGNFALEGLVGFDMNGRTAGVVGTGRIGEVVAKILTGFGCRVLAFDPQRNPAIEAMGGTYTELDTLLAESDIVTLHCPLMPATHHLINAETIATMKRGAMLINTSRGALVDAAAVIDGLKSGQIGRLGLDVYEEEADLFFENLSDQVLQDDIFARLLTFPNVVITGHQAFFTDDARAIAETTLDNLTQLDKGKTCPNAVSAKNVRA